MFTATLDHHGLDHRLDHRTVPSTSDPLKARYEIDGSLPRELRDEARDMDWGLFMATYAPEPTLKVALTGERRIDWLNKEYSFDILAAPKTSAAQRTSCLTTASGPIQALSQTLHQHGRYVEVLAFHEISIFEATATCLKVAHPVKHARQFWVIGFGATPAQSAAAAMSAGAQRVHGNL